MSLKWNVVVFYPHDACAALLTSDITGMCCVLGWQESQTKYNSTASHRYTLEAGKSHL